MDIKEEIIKFSKKIEVEAIGFCPTESETGVYLENAKTFIVILESYNIFNKQEQPEKLYGKISRAAVFEDYHKIVNRKLDRLKEYIYRTFGCNSKGFCDISPFSDREIAKKAGLGVIGRNSFLINEQFGTAIYIGYLLTDLEIENYDLEIEKDFCKECKKCKIACPADAISFNNKINVDKCVSYLTQAKEIPNELKASMKNNLYGCDICQLVCPYNSPSNKNKYFKSIIDEYYSLEDLLKINNSTFNETIKKTSAGWRGKKTLQRNAIIALGNNGNSESVQLLNKHSNDKREDIRMEIINSLGRINTVESKEVLKDRLLIEENESIKEQIIKYLK